MPDEIKNEDRYFINTQPPDPIFDIPFAGISYPNPRYMKRRDSSMKLLVFEYVIRGSGEIHSEKLSSRLGEGDLYIINASYPQVYFSDRADPYEKIWVNATGRLVESLAEVYIPGKSFVVCHGCESCYDDFLRIHSLLHDSSNIHNQNRRREIFDEISLILHRLLLAAVRGQGRPVPEKLSSDKLAVAIKSAIDRRVTQPLNLRELSERYFVSVNHIIRCFCLEYGITPKQYQLKRRIDTADELMLNTDLSLGEIAGILGFTSLQHFSATYRRYRGYPPAKKLQPSDG